MKTETTIIITTEITTIITTITTTITTKKITIDNYIKNNTLCKK